MSQKPAQWYFDFLSPFSWLQWNQLDVLRGRLTIQPIPIVLAALLNHFGLKGPAEVPAKRAFTYRFLVWQAQRANVPLRFPPTHPFNPLPALRLAVALEAKDQVIDAIFREIWQHGRTLDQPEVLTSLGERFGLADVATTIGAPAIKQRLRQNTEAAITNGVFGVPTLCVDGQCFFGNDATPMLEDWLANPAQFDAPAYTRLIDLPVGVSRP